MDEVRVHGPPGMAGACRGRRGVRQPALGAEVGRGQFREQGQKGRLSGALRPDNVTKINVISPPSRNETAPMRCNRRRNCALGDVNAYGRRYSKRRAFISRPAAAHKPMGSGRIASYFRTVEDVTNLF